MEEITRNDLIFFQNEVLKDMKLIENKINDKISAISNTTKNSSLILEQKIENLKKKLDETIQTLDINNKIEKINDKFDKFKSKFEERILINNTKIASFERELSNACFKYDKIFLNNISSPGLIGDGCPFPTMRSFLEFSNNKIKEIISSKEKFFIDFKEYENWVKLTLDKFREENNDFKNKTNEFLIKEIKYYDKRSFEKINIVEDKLNSIKIENGNYNYNLNKKWEELEEKLKLFNNIKDNIINTYNNCRKEYIQIKNKFNDLSKYFKTMKLTSNNSNRAFFDEMSKKTNINKKQKIDIENSKYNNILPMITSLEEASKVLLDRKNDNSIQNFNIEIKKNKLSKKKSLKIENIDLSNMNIENTIKNYNLKKNFNKNNILTNAESFKILNDINDTTNNEIFYRNKLLKKNSIKINKNNYLNQQNKEEGSEILNDNISINQNIENFGEQQKESSILISDDNDDEVNKEKNEKEINNINNDNEVELQHSNSKINLATNEQKITSIKKNKENDNKLLNDYNIDKIVTKMNLDEELYKINQKFDNLYEKANNKIISIVHQINILINKINRSIFQKENIKTIKEINFSLNRKKRNIVLNNSEMGLCLPYNKTYDHNYNNDKKNLNEKENSLNDTNKKNYRDLYNNRININIIDIDRKKLGKVRTNSNDLFSLIKIKKKNNNISDSIKFIDKQSINKIESYLIKKFSETN